MNIRLDKFREKAVPLVSAVCKKAVDDAGISMEDIGKLVVVSSTGFLGPGLDCAIIEEIGLSRGVDRECSAAPRRATLRLRPADSANSLSRAI